MRVLHVVATNERRGAEVFASDLTRELKVFDADQQVAVLRGNRTPIVFEAPTTVLGPVGPSIPGLRIDLSAFRTLRALVRQWRPHVIQVHGGEPLKYTVPAARAVASNIVYRRIGATPDGLAGPARRATYRQLMRRTSKIVAVAEAARRETVEGFGVPNEKIVTIPNAVDSGRFCAPTDREAIRRDLGIPLEASVLLSVGALTWEKAPLEQLQIASRIMRRLQSVVYLLAGDGPLRSEVEAAIELGGLSGRVRVLGSRADVADLMAASDALVLTSCTEGMPAVVIEAGIVGLPVAAYAVAGVPEVVVHTVTGLLAPPGNLPALEGLVLELLASKPLRSTLGQAARERCRAKFDIKVIAPQYLALYQELMAAA